MEISNLNQRITFLEQRTKKDAIGNHTSKWDEAFSLWACAKVSRSDEKEEAGVTKEVQSMDFWVRESSLTKHLKSNKYRILFDGGVYNITGVIYDYVKKDYLKITAERCGDDHEFCG